MFDHWFITKTASNAHHPVLGNSRHYNLVLLVIFVKPEWTVNKNKPFSSIDSNAKTFKSKTQPQGIYRL